METSTSQNSRIKTSKNYNSLLLMRVRRRGYNRVRLPYTTISLSPPFPFRFLLIYPYICPVLPAKFISILYANSTCLAVHSLTDTCWKKCITGTIRNGKLDKNEETCAQNCVDRFLDANMTVIKHLDRMRNTS
jgi:hypothetical protein